MPFLFHCLLERHVVSSVFYIPGTYHPSISYLSSRWRSPVSSGEASPGNLFTVAGKEKWHMKDQKWKWIKQHNKIKEWKFTQEWKRFCHQGNQPLRTAISLTLSIFSAGSVICICQLGVCVYGLVNWAQKRAAEITRQTKVLAPGLRTRVQSGETHVTEGETWPLKVVL